MYALVKTSLTECFNVILSMLSIWLLCMTKSLHQKNHMGLCIFVEIRKFWIIVPIFACDIGSRHRKSGRWRVTSTNSTYLSARRPFQIMRSSTNFLRAQPGRNLSNENSIDKIDKHLWPDFRRAISVPSTRNMKLGTWKLKIIHPHSAGSRLHPRNHQNHSRWNWHGRSSSDYN